MFKIKISLIISVLLAIILFINCTKDPEFSIIPEIQFVEYIQYKNDFGKDTALKIIISYTDGDGDLGLEQNDTFPPFNSGSLYHSCMYIYYYEFVDSQFVEVRPEIGGIPVGDTIRFPYRFRNLTPDTPNKTIKGEIEWHTNLIQPQKNNYIKFKIFIFDRKLHKSNEVETPVIFYNY
ncbi:MAG: hypothetical protein ISR55_06130 [Bacteroidetes bacterium]|nr:hypothetical protein [Bacteroidota bacterium]MBL6963380.1 hypothetical protein [Bacteroidota bacterium]